MAQKYLHEVTPDFWDHYFDLPKRIRKLAMQKRELMKQDPRTVNLKKGVLSGYVRNVNMAAYDHPLYALKAVFRRCEPENLHVDKAASGKEVLSVRQSEPPS